MRVLVAHPDPATRLRVRECLRPLHYVVDAADDVAAILPAVRESAYDVVLVGPGAADVGELVAAVKTGPHGHSTGIVLVGYDMEFDRAMVALERGAYDFLREPLNPAELVARVQAARRHTSLQGELIAQSRRLEMLIVQDPLTGLQNRRFIIVQLGALLSGAHRHGRPVSVVMIDLDHFKALNDTYGHETGDRALVGVARALRGRLRAEDYLGRLGGEEFLALLPDTGEEHAGAVAESLRRCASAVEVPTAAGELIGITASIGWATWSGSGETAEHLIRRADRALYAAKAAGRDLVREG